MRGRCFSLGLMLLLGLAALISGLDSGPLQAAEGDLDPAFVPAGVSNLPLIRGKVDYPDGRYLLYGDFTQINGVAVKSLARFQANGSLDTSFTPPISGEVRAVVLMDDGRILVGGEISVNGGYPYWYFRVARLNSDGSVDTTFALTLDWYGQVNSLAVQSDGRILVGGWSLTVRGDSSATYYLLRLYADGSVDNTYPKRSAPDGVVHKLLVLNDDPANPNRCRVLGNLPNISGGHTGYVVTFLNNGTLQSALTDETFNGPVFAYVRQSDGKTVYVGSFTQVLGASRNRIVRLHTDNSLDTSFNPGTGFNDFANNVLLQTDGKLVVVGNFSAYNGANVGPIVRLTSTGARDTTFTATADDRILRLSDSGGNILLCGAFRAVNGQTRNGIALLDSAGNLLSAYSSVTNQNTQKAVIYSVLPLPDGKVMVGGRFTGLGGKYHRGLGRLNPDGSLDSSFRQGVAGYVRTLARQNDGKILAGGYFGPVGGFSRTSLARFNTDDYLDQNFKPIITKADGSVSELWRVVPLSNGQILAAGHFQQVEGQPRSQVVRLNANGTLDNTFTSQITITDGTNIRPYAVVLTPDNKYAVAGYVVYQGLVRGFLCRLLNSGAMDTTFTPTSPSPNVVITAGEVNDLVVQPDGQLVIGGVFTQIKDGSWDPPNRKHLARFSATGVLDSTFGTAGPDNVVNCLVRQADGKFLLGGNFTKYIYPGWFGPTYDANRVARILSDGNFDSTFTTMPGADDEVFALALRPVGARAVVGGQFTSYHGTPRGGLAQIIAGGAAAPGIWELLLF